MRNQNSETRGAAGERQRGAGVESQRLEAIDEDEAEWRFEDESRFRLQAYTEDETESSVPSFLSSVFPTE
ncbi:hypothetical protein CDL15_Pgr014147 [Punica granatum]|uniref:Uncharacterized protein n=1 Tax=Punica granatum TaxID=22663 RepID=A0A218XI08_PUNGR|nr:hypothetical protein CDL15_Pgr014147 [Punica granatum]